jgi:hypothetical protein
MEFDKLTDEEKKQFILQAVNKHAEYEPNFNIEKLKLEIESSIHNEYIDWETKFVKQYKDVGYLSSNNKIQGETCDFCRKYNESKIYESQSKLLKHLTICKYNPNNVQNGCNIINECKYCKKQMGNKYNLEQHEMKCSNININIDSFNELLCQYCLQYCKTKFKKHAHELTCLKNAVIIEKLTCKTCNKFMMNEYNLNIHQEKCKNTIKCKHCQRELKTNLLMPSHLENCDAYITHLQSINLPINLDDVPDVDLNILIKNALK